MLMWVQDDSWSIYLTQQNVTSHVKRYTNGFPFSNGIPFTSRLLAVQNKFAPVRTAWVIRSERNCIRSNGLIIRSVQTSIRLNGLVIRSEKKLHPFERLSHPFGTNIHPFERLDHPFRKK